MGMKVAIVGLAPSTHSMAPWGDPEWELWGLAWDSDRMQLDRTFEMHDLEMIKDYPVADQYLESLIDCSRLYMQERYQEVPGSHRYPFEAVAKTTGDYWCSSIAYAMALAIHEGASEIALFGVDMKGTEEYGYQKPNMEYLIGLARGKGIKVHIPKESPLCKFVSDPDFAYIGRYGSLKHGNH